MERCSLLFAPPPQLAQIAGGLVHSEHEAQAVAAEH
jgi:hypothetical protein